MARERLALRIAAGYQPCPDPAIARRPLAILIVWILVDKTIRTCGRSARELAAASSGRPRLIEYLLAKNPALNG